MTAEWACWRRKAANGERPRTRAVYGKGASAKNESEERSATRSSRADGRYDDGLVPGAKEKGSVTGVSVRFRALRGWPLRVLCVSPQVPQGVEEDPGGIRETGGAALPASSARDIRSKGRAPGGGTLRVRRWGLGQFPSRRAPRVRPLPASRDLGNLPVGVPREDLRADPRAPGGEGPGEGVLWNHSEGGSERGAWGGTDRVGHPRGCHWQGVGLMHRE